MVFSAARWRNGSAFDSRSKGCRFESYTGHPSQSRYPYFTIQDKYRASHRPHLWPRGRFCRDRAARGAMTYKRFVEVGRIALICYGPDAGKLCTIINILDHNRVLVDGPEKITGVHRHEINIKRIMLTDLTIPAKLNMKHKCVLARFRNYSQISRVSRCCWPDRQACHACLYRCLCDCGLMAAEAAAFQLLGLGFEDGVQPRC
eukprot:1325924-Pleurochrysis_carterae.AAC.5